MISILVLDNLLHNLLASSRLYWLCFSNSWRNMQMYRKTFFFGPGRIRIISQHLSYDSAYRQSSSNGDANGSGDDSISISRASAAACGVPAIYQLNDKNDSNEMVRTNYNTIKIDMFCDLRKSVEDHILSQSRISFMRGSFEYLRSIPKRYGVLRPLRFKKSTNK